VRPDPVYDYPPPVYTPPGPEDPYRPVPRTEPKRDRTITLAGVTGNVDMPYGKQQLGGQVMFAYRHAPDDQLWLVVPLGWGETDGEWGELLLNDRPVSSWTSTYAQYWFYRGAPGQTADPNLATVLPSWNETLDNVTYGILKLRAFGVLWQSMPNMKWRFKGRRCLDPGNLTNPIAYSTNLWVQNYDYRRDPAGQALPEAALLTSDWAAAATTADEVMGDGAKRYEYHPLITDDASVEDWLAEFDIAGNGHPWWDGQQLRLFLDRPASPSASVNDSDLLRQGYQFDRRNDPFTKPNNVVVYFADESDGFNREAFEESKTAALLAGDEDPVTVTHKIWGIHKRSQAKRLSIFLLNDLVFDGVLSRTERATAVEREPGDVITVVQAAKGLNQAFRALGVTRNSDHTYDIEYLEYDAARYSDTTVADESTIKSVFGDPRAQPPYPAGVAVDDKDAPEDVQSTSWTEIPNRSTTVYDNTFWATVNCGNVDLAAINDGGFASVALDFNVAGQSEVKFDAGAGNTIEFRELVAAATGTGIVTCAIEYSDDGSGYTQAATIQLSELGAYLVDENGSGFSPARRVASWGAPGDHRHWKVRQIGSSAVDVNITELQFYEFLGQFPWIDVAILTAEGDNPSGATVALAKPEAKRVDTMSLGSFAYEGLNDSGHTKTWESQLHARSLHGLISWGVAQSGGSSAAPNTTGYAPEFLTKGLSAVTLANGDNHNVTISSIATVIRFSGLTAAGAVTGIVAKDGTNNTGEAGRVFVVWNDNGQALTLRHQNVGSSTANRLVCPGGVDIVLAAGEHAIIFYEEVNSRWRVYAGTSGGGVSSVFGRTGDVVAESGDYGAFYRLLSAAIGTSDLANNAVTNAKLRDSAALSVLGRAANSLGDPADIAAASDHQVLRRSGTALGFGAVNLAGANAVTGTLPDARLSANVPLLDAANTFTGGTQKLQNQRLEFGGTASALTGQMCRNDTHGLMMRLPTGTARDMRILSPGGLDVILDVTSVGGVDFGGAISWGGGGALASSDEVVKRASCKVTSTDATTSLPNVTWVTLSFTTESWDDEAFHDNVTNPSRLTVPTGMAGRYELAGQVEHGGVNAGRYVRILKNGTTVVGFFAFNAGSLHGRVLQVVGLDSATAGDYYELQVQIVAGTTTLASALAGHWFAIKRV
jgi:hypothetical protein